MKKTRKLPKAVRPEEFKEINIDKFEELSEDEVEILTQKSSDPLDMFYNFCKDKIYKVQNLKKEVKNG